MPQRRPLVRQNRSIERKVVVLALAGIAAVTALVIVAWKFGGGDPATQTPPAAKAPQKTAATGLRFVGLGKGTYLEIRRGSSTGAVLYQGTLQRGASEFVTGKRFCLTVRRSAGVSFKLAGRPVSLPAGRNLKVLVTPTKTARACG